MPARTLPGVFLALLALVASHGCTPTRTAIVVVVDSNLAATTPVRSVRTSVGDGACGDGTCTHDFLTSEPSAFPFSFVVEPRGATNARFTLSVVARDAAGAALVSREIETGFVPGRTLRLIVRLEEACRTISCSDTDTCADGVCVSRLVPPESLAEVSPGRELDDLRDGGTPTGRDAGDASGSSSLPRSCADLAAGAPGGATEIDPDGEGGAAPFSAFCENEGDGGGWTLLLKVDPESDALGFDAAAWTSATPTPFGSADESVGDALLMPYWSVPIEALRVGSDGRFAVLRPTTATTPRTLADAIGAGELVELDATPATWAEILGETLHTSEPCVRSGLLATIPDVASSALGVRIGLVGSSSDDCMTPTYWYGIAPAIGTIPVACRPTTNTAGGGVLCGPGPARVSRPRFLVVYGR